MKWISVKDRLPSVIITQSYWVIAYDGIHVGIAFYSSESNWNSVMLNENKITHWMPLPEPPKTK